MRVGGLCALVALRVAPAAIQRIGRWSSECWRVYMRSLGPCDMSRLRNKMHLAEVTPLHASMLPPMSEKEGPLLTLVDNPAGGI